MRQARNADLSCLGQPDSISAEICSTVSGMTKWIGTAALALTLISGGSAVIDRAAAAPSPTAVQGPEAGQATLWSARRHARPHMRYIYRRYEPPTYYERPYYYAPAPFVPFNYGYGLWPWR